MKIKEVIEEIIEELESWDCKVNKNNIITTLKKWIKNLTSYTKRETYQELEEYGIANKTGMTVEEMIRDTHKRVMEYRNILDMIEQSSILDDYLEKGFFIFPS